jgi:exosortase
MRVDKELVLKNIRTHRYPYLLVALLVVLNIPVLTSLISDWMRDGNYSHGFFIIPISIWLFYRERKRLVFPAKNSGWGMALVVVGAIGMILGIAAGEYFTTRVSMVLVLSGIAWYYLGSSNFRKVWFAFFFLLFMIPIPSIIYYAATLPMQLLSSKVTVGLLKIIGMPVARNGNIIMLPNYSLEVAEACSGLRSLVTLMALGALYAYLKMPGRTLPVILFAATVPIAIVTNIFRIFVTAVGAYAISKDLAESFLHELSGLLVFITALILVIILGALLVWIRKRLQS